MVDDTPLHERLQTVDPSLTLPPTGWTFTNCADQMFELQPEDADEDDERLFHVTEDPVFSPGNIVTQYYNAKGKRDKLDWPMDDLNEHAKFIQMKLNLPENR